MTADLKAAAQQAFNLLDRLPINEGYHDETVEVLDALRAGLAAQAPAEAHGLPPLPPLPPLPQFYAHFLFTADQMRDYARAAIAANVQPKHTAPIDMVLHCPSCGLQHIDGPDERTEGWKNEPHRSHLCHGCGHIWRPADVPTNGVQAVQTKGKADSPIRAPAVGAEPVRYPHPDEDDPVTLWKEIRRLRAAMSQAKCDCTAYCGQYVLHGSCRAHPAPVTISHVPVQHTAAPEPIRCPERLKNGGTCPHHNLQCGWPACNKGTE